MPIHHELRRLLEQHETLTFDEAAALMSKILAGEAQDVEIAALIAALAARGETAPEIAGFAQTLRAAANPFPFSGLDVVDTCGTGGDASGTFNISTAAALVAAAAGANVAKHGNRAVTSTCGSADVLEALGIPIHLTPEAAAQSLRDHNFCFLLAPAHHPQMKALMPVRRALGVRSVLHILGPLLNPAGARRQVMGVYHPRLVPLVANAMILLGIDHAMVVHGDAGLDEIALSGPTQIAEVRNATVTTYTLDPAALGLTPAPLSALIGGDAPTNAAILTAIFAGERSPRRDIVLLNAAAVLITSGIAPGLREGLARSAQAIDDGSTSALVQSLRSTL